MQQFRLDGRFHSLSPSLSTQRIQVQCADECRPMKMQPNKKAKLKSVHAMNGFAVESSILHQRKTIERVFKQAWPNKRRPI